MTEAREGERGISRRLVGLTISETCWTERGKRNGLASFCPPVLVHARPVQVPQVPCLHLHTQAANRRYRCQLSDKEHQCLGQKMARQGCREPPRRQGGGIHWLAPAARRGGRGRAAAVGLPSPEWGAAGSGCQGGPAQKRAREEQRPRRCAGVLARLGVVIQHDARVLSS
jgi:hypothetical protein